METFEFIFDEVSNEIFPNEIWQDPNIVFHGTSQYHSQTIENNGFVPATCPFGINDAKELSTLLQLPQLGDKGSKFSRNLNSYIDSIENNNFRLSFTYLSFLSVLYASGQSKGGQILGTIRQAHSIITQAIRNNLLDSEVLTEPINRLFNLETNTSNENGVIYAVRLEQPYDGITEEYGTIHSTRNILPQNIIGKVILPNGYNTYGVDISQVKQINREKLLRPGHLGILLNRSYYDDSY
ncbi:hypothetical protein [Chryseobacterium bernardetii]|uniref:hypothetical protein n=1 Tax=Chryseobacterium bernardetii TaxID=1241978 RepID=UPI003AF76C9B